MALIVALSRYVPLERVPQIDINTHLANIFSDVSEKGVGGFFLTERERPAYFIRATELASAIFSRLGGKINFLPDEGYSYIIDNSVSSHYIQLSNEVISSFMNIVMLGSELNTIESGWHDILEGGVRNFIDSDDNSSYLLRVADDEINTDTDSLIFSGEMGLVYPVRHMTQHVGWLFPEEQWSRSIFVPSPVYVCLAGHHNRHKDNGRCTHKSGCVEPITMLITGV